MGQVILSYRVFAKANIFAQELSREQSPNRGFSVPEDQAISSNRELSAEWQKRNGIDPLKQIRLVRIGHMRYQHPDLSEITKFLRGSGVTVLVIVPN